MSEAGHGPRLGPPLKPQFRPGLGAALFARLLWRDLRASPGRVVFFAACLALGVAAVVAVAGLSNALEQTIRSRAREILAADVAVAARRPLPEDLARRFQERGFESTSVREMASLVSAPGGKSQLVELKVVDGEYPFYGALTLEPAGALATLLDETSCAVGPELLARLRLARGDELKIGEARFKIAAVVVAEPDRMNFSLTLGPRVFVTGPGFARAELEKQGSSIRYTLLGKSEGGAKSARALAEEIRAEEPAATYLNIQTYEEAQPLLRDGIRRTNRFLALAALSALFVGGIGIAQTVRAWVARSLDAIAIHKCLGLTSREILALCVGQTALLALCGSLLGAALGIGAEALVVDMFRDLVPGERFELFQPAALARGIALGLFVALLFSLRPLRVALAVPPARVLRRDAEPLEGSRASRLGLAALFAAGVVAAGWVQSESLGFALGFAAALFAAAGLLWLAALGLVRLCARPGRERLPLALRHGLAALARPGAGTLSGILSLGLGILVVLSMQLVHQELSHELSGELPRGAPTVFLVDVQSSQWDGVRGLLEREGASEIESAPVVVARLARIDGRGVEELVKERRAQGNPRWTMTREQRMTYGAELPPDNEVVESIPGEGGLWRDPARPEISVERDFAESLGVRLGSTLAFDLQGVELEFTVTSLRRVEWRTFRLNFFLLVEPGVLEAAPQFRVAAARVSKDREDGLQDELAVEYPNVTLLRVREILEKLASVLQKVGRGVSLLGWCSVLSGAVILVGAVAAGASRRAREVALFKTLGLTRGAVALVYGIEHGLTGLVAGLIGAAGANALAWGIVRYGMELEFRFDAVATLAAVLVAALFAALAGLGASLRPLFVPPIAALRD